MSPEPTLAAPQLLTDQDLYLFNEGSNYRLYDKMGAHLVTHNGQSGVVFSVWAPNARSQFRSSAASTDGIPKRIA